MSITAFSKMEMKDFMDRWEKENTRSMKEYIRGMTYWYGSPEKMMSDLDMQDLDGSDWVTKASAAQKMYSYMPFSNRTPQNGLGVYFQHMMNKGSGWLRKNTLFDCTDEKAAEKKFKCVFMGNKVELKTIEEDDSVMADANLHAPSPLNTLSYSLYEDKYADKGELIEITGIFFAIPHEYAEFELQINSVVEKVNRTWENDIQKKVCRHGEIRYEQDVLDLGPLNREQYSNKMREISAESFMIAKPTMGLHQVEPRILLHYQARGYDANNPELVGLLTKPVATYMSMSNKPQPALTEGATTDPNKPESINDGAIITRANIRVRNSLQIRKGRTLTDSSARDFFFSQYYRQFMPDDIPDTGSFQPRWRSIKGIEANTRIDEVTIDVYDALKRSGMLMKDDTIRRFVVKALTGNENATSSELYQNAIARGFKPRTTVTNEFAALDSAKRYIVAVPRGTTDGHVPPVLFFGDSVLIADSSAFPDVRTNVSVAAEVAAVAGAATRTALTEAWESFLDNRPMNDPGTNIPLLFDNIRLLPPGAVNNKDFRTGGVGGRTFADIGGINGPVSGRARLASFTFPAEVEIKSVQTYADLLRVVERTHRGTYSSASSLQQRANLLANPGYLTDKLALEAPRRVRSFDNAHDLRFWEEMIENQEDVPLGFVHWRTIKVKTGMAVYWIAGEKTGFTVCQFSKVTPVEAIDDTRLRVDIRFRPGVFIVQPRNIVCIPNIVPLEYKGGATTDPFSFEDKDLREFRANRAMLPNMVTFAMGVDEAPKNNFWTAAGIMNPRNYQGPETSESMFCTSDGYCKLMEIDASHDHIVPNSELEDEIARTRVVCMQAAQLIYSPDGGGSISRLIPGADPMGPDFKPSDYNMLGGVYNIVSSLGNYMYPPKLA